jgi:hypothetical protein
VPSTAFVYARLQPAPFLHTGKKGIESARAHLIAVSTQLTHDPLATDGLHRAVIGDVGVTLLAMFNSLRVLK